MSVVWQLTQGFDPLTFVDDFPNSHMPNEAVSKLLTAIAIAAYAQLPQKTLADALVILAHQPKSGGLSCEFNGWIYTQAEALKRMHPYRDSAGYVTAVRNPVGGWNVLYKAAEAGLDSSDGKWATVCETHGAICNHTTKRTALSHLAWSEWCEECQRAVLQ